MKQYSTINEKKERAKTVFLRYYNAMRFVCKMAYASLHNAWCPKYDKTTNVFDFKTFMGEANAMDCSAEDFKELAALYNDVMTADDENINERFEAFVRKADDNWCITYAVDVLKNINLWDDDLGEYYEEDVVTDYGLDD